MYRINGGTYTLKIWPISGMTDRKLVNLGVVE